MAGYELPNGEFSRKIPAILILGSNAESLFGVERVPCDNHIRSLLDPMDVVLQEGDKVKLVPYTGGLNK